MVPQRLAGALIVAAATVAIASLTLGPTLAGAAASRWCIVCGRYVIGDVLLNIALFLPLGLGLGLLGIPRRRSFAIALIATVAIELAQGFLLRGRFASISDVVTNTSGGVLGHVLATRWRALVFPDRTAALRLGAGALVLWLAVLGGASWALSPVLAPGEYRAHSARAYRGHDDASYVASAAMRESIGVIVPPGDSAAVGRALGNRRLLLVARFDPPPSASVAVAFIDRPGSRPAITLRHEQNLLMLTVHTPAHWLLLHEPTLFSGPIESLPRSADSLVAIAGGLDGDTVRMFVMRDSAVVHRSSLPLAPALWPYLLTGAGPVPNFVVPFSALSNGVLLALAAYWLFRAAMASRRTRSRGAAAATAISGAAIVAGLAGIPALSRLAPTPDVLWLVAIAATVAGAVSAAVVARYERDVVALPARA